MSHKTNVDEALRAAAEAEEAWLAWATACMARQASNTPATVDAEQKAFFEAERLEKVAQQLAKDAGVSYPPAQ